MRQKLLARWSIMALLTACAGCHSREVLRLDRHPTHSVLLVQTLEKRNYLVTATAERAVWVCPEQNGVFVCRRQCGDDTGYSCHSDLFFSNGTANDVR